MGRANECEIVLPSVRVSRLHATITASDDGKTVTIVDEGSTNGIFVNAERVKAHRLADRDMIQVGEHHLLYVEP